MRVAVVTAVLFALALTTPCGRAAAQVVSVPTFSVADASQLIALDVAGNYRGLFVLTETASGVDMRPFINQQWLTPIPVDGVPEGGHWPEMAVDPRGGFTLFWGEDSQAIARFFDDLGNPSGSRFIVSSFGTTNTRLPRVVGLPAGPAFLWAEAFPDGDPSLHLAMAGRRVQVGYSAPSDFNAAGTRSGGLVVAWREYNGVEVRRWGQVFDDAGFPQGDPFPLSATDFAVTGVGASPVGDVIAVAGVAETGPRTGQIVVHRFDSSGAALGPEILVDTVSYGPNQHVSSNYPDVAFDYAGDMYVVWGDGTAGKSGVRVRAFDPAGVPFGPPVTVATQIPFLNVKSALLPDGRFANAWSTSGLAGWINVVSLCTGGAVCGDGVLVGACERCDDGAANDDAVPDACRSNCLPAHCGDGTVDGGEQCDDGNLASCDGCTPGCQSEIGIVCGDGVVSTACGEQCDDANATPFDGCASTCERERIPGGGSVKTDCFSEWSIDNTANPVPLDKHGAINAKQVCTDDDPACDFDGGTPGSCTFHVRVCANNTNVARCQQPSRLSTWVVDRPSAKQADQQPALTGIRAALAVVPGAIVGPTGRDLCTDEIALTVPLLGSTGAYQASTVKLETRATSYEGKADKDKLKLQCLPAS